MFIRIALVAAVMATTVTAASANPPALVLDGANGTQIDAPQTIRRPGGDGYLIITMEN